jgi:hypothetical protein
MFTLQPPRHIPTLPIASFERCRHVCFTPDSGRMTGTQRTDALLRSKMHLFDHLVGTHKD